MNINKKFKLRMYDEEGNLVEIVERSIREMMESMEFNGSKIWINIADLGGGLIAGFFSSVVPGIQAFIEAWTKEAGTQMWWKLDKRGVHPDDNYEVLSTCFQPECLLNVNNSKWSKSKGMAVIVKKKETLDFDLDQVFKNDGTVDYNMGLNDEEKKDRALVEKIEYGAVKHGDFAARGIKRGFSVQTATPNKKTEFVDDEVEDDPMARSVKTYNVDTTIGGATTGDASMAGTMASEVSMESITAEDWLRQKNMAGEEEEEYEEEGSEEDEESSREGSDFQPPSIQRNTGENLTPAESGAGGSEIVGKEMGQQIESMRRVQEEEEAFAVLEWSKHLC